MDAVGNTVGANRICPSRCLLNFEATTITMETNNGCSLSGAEGTPLEIIEFIGWDSASLTHPCSGFLEIKGDRVSWDFWIEDFFAIDGVACNAPLHRWHWICGDS
jgi:hypothetical protein